MDTDSYFGLSNFQINVFQITESRLYQIKGASQSVRHPASPTPHSPKGYQSSTQGLKVSGKQESVHTLGAANMFKHVTW
jgi:hypothetical protein